MADNSTKGRWRRVLPYIVGAFLLLLAAVAATQGGAPWYVSVGMACVAMIIILGKRRIFRPSVSRAGDEVICRYIPWYEGNAYLFCLLFPLMGASMTTAGRNPSNPGWLRLGGIILLCVAGLLLWSVVHVWRRSLLQISTSAVTLRSGTLGSKLTKVAREQLESISLKGVPHGVGGQSLQVEIAYHSQDSRDSAIETALIGPHLTVRPINLLNALTAWKDATDDDPEQLLDRIEHILRDRSLVDV